MNLSPSDVPSKSSFIFMDLRGHRWPRLRRIVILLGVVVFLAAVLFVQTLFLNPDLALPRAVRHLKGQLKALENIQPPQAPAVKPTTALKNFLHIHPAHPARTAAQLNQKPPREIHAGFYVKWDPYSAASLEKNATSLTHVCPEWMSVADGTGALAYDRDAEVVDQAQRHGLVLVPFLNNLIEGEWQPDAVESIANGPQERRDQFIAAITHELDTIGAGGVIIDWESLDPSYKDEVTALLSQLATSLHAKKRELWLLVSLGDDAKVFDLDALSDVVDHFVASLSDENGDDDSPGPVASQDWVESWIEEMSDYGDPGQWIAALGTYGYDWTTGVKTGEQISFPDAMTRASYAGEQDVKVAPPLYNPSFSYYEGADQHTVWFLDATTFWNDLQLVRAKKWGGYAVNRLGAEDPAIWTVATMPPKPRPDDVRKITALIPGPEVTNIGRGEIVSVDESSDSGKRTFTASDDGPSTSDYTDFPTYPTLYHQGGNNPKQVGITFDDGPDPVWTPKILDILKQRGVKATFFLVGSQAEKYPRLVRRIVEEGHTVGNHTYTHSNLGVISEQQVKLELNATQRLIETITGRSTALFRPPYNADSQPSSPRELVPLSIAQDLNYLIVLESIDPEDWARPGVQEIVSRVREQRSSGNIILLHDAGGDRSQTVAALPQIIDWLEERGDQIVPIETLLNMTRDDLMPPVPPGSEKFPLLVSGIGFETLRLTAEFLWSLMIVATVLVGLRTLLVAFLATRHQRRLPPERPDFHPPVSVIIAAYNEQKVIAATLRSVLDTDYPGELEILIINDGSKDETSRAVQEIMAAEPRVHLLEQENAGKSIALRNGIAATAHDTIVFLDADTHFEPATIRRLVQPLADPAVGAVSGHAKVGNLRSFIARCQSLEYICGFNLDRRAYAFWNCITVAPGAISAFRKSVITAAGGISTDTLAEDTDLTLCLHRIGSRIDYAPGAVAWTEAPETFRTLAKQRFRWAFGTLQCLWKHRDLVFNPHFQALGLFSLPGIWFFQIFLVAITPFVDLCLLLAIWFGNGPVVLPYLCFFILTDFLLALLACWMEGESLRKAFLVLPMRFIYRPLMSWVVWRSIIQALRGAFVAWGKLERTASVAVRRTSSPS